MCAWILILFVVSLGGGAATSAAEVAPATITNPTIADLDWLVGSWHGEGLGGQFEEHWTEASGSTMMGAFRLVVEDEMKVIEYIMITEEEGRIAYRFKHFRADYSTWEKDQPLDFTLIRLSETEAIFHSEVPEQNAPRRITYQRVGENGLQVEVAGSDDSGQISDSFELTFTRESR